MKILNAQWPPGYSAASRLVSALFLIDGPASALTVVGELPADVTGQTLRPFLDESFRPDPSTGRRDGSATLLLTDGAGAPLYVEAEELAPGGGVLAACSAFPAFGLFRGVLGLVLLEARRDNQS